MKNVCSVYLYLVILHLFHFAISETVIHHTGVIRGKHDANRKEQTLAKDDPRPSLNTRVYINRIRRYKKSLSLLPEPLGRTYNSLTHRPLDSRLHIGSKNPPPLPGYDSKPWHNTKKRSTFDVGLAVPACPFTTEWKMLRLAMDDNNTMVEVFQPGENSYIYSNRYQWFYTVACDFTIRQRSGRRCINCCSGTDETHYSSRCIPRKSYVSAFIRRPGSRDYHWGYIRVASSCNCALSERRS